MQKHHEIAIELAPLVTLFNELSEPKMALYCKALETYDIAVIRVAVGKVQKKWDRVSFPPPGVIVQECEKQGVGAKKILHIDNPWEKRDRENLEAANNYFFGWRTTSTIFAQAVTEGWDYLLMKYVKAVASLQAQILNPPPYGKIAVEWHRMEPQPAPGLNMDKWRKDFLSEQVRDARNRGSIEVALPTGKIHEWQTVAMLEGMKKKAA